MLKKFLTVMLTATVVSQGIARADETAGSDQVRTEPTQAALLAHLDGMTAGDRVAIATVDGVVAGELVDQDADDVVIDRPLIEGGAERIAIPLKEVQGVRYQFSQPSKTTVAGKVLVVTVVVLAAIWLVPRLILPKP
jgi:hypothetical protein